MLGAMNDAMVVRLLLPVAVLTRLVARWCWVAAAAAVDDDGGGSGSGWCC